MGKKRVEEEECVVKQAKEWENLLGRPKFKKLENGRLKCAETGHEVPPHAKDSYARSKHCRLGLIDSALARNKPPLNYFLQDPLYRSKLFCKITEFTINKSEEHIWKHITGKRFLDMLEKEEAEKQEPSEIVPEQVGPAPETKSKPKADVLKEKKKKKKREENASKVVSKVKSSFDKECDPEEAHLLIPPVGNCLDFNDSGERKSVLETGDSNRTDAANEGTKDDANEGTKDDDARELSKRTKRPSMETGPSSFASRKKKKKNNCK